MVFAPNANSYSKYDFKHALFVPYQRCAFPDFASPPLLPHDGIKCYFTNGHRACGSVHTTGLRG